MTGDSSSSMSGVCSSCGRPQRTNAQFCSSCGGTVTSQMTVLVPARSLVPWIATGAATAVVLLVALIFLIGREDTTATGSDVTPTTSASETTTVGVAASVSSTTNLGSSSLLPTHAELGGRFGYGDAVAGEILIANDYDLWAFTGFDDDVVTATLITDDVNRRVYLEIYDQGGWRRAHTECSSGLARVLNLQLNGEGAFTVHAGSCDDSVGAYELTLAKKVPNGFIDVGSAVTGELTVIDDYELWAFDGSKNDVVTILMATNDSSRHVYLEVYDEGGWRRAYENCTVDSAQILNYEIIASGTFYIHAGSCEGSIGGYSLTLTKK